MAAAAQLISLEEYLRTSYHPDCDFVDGEIVARNLGEYEHGRLQTLLIVWFANHEKQWDIRVLTELRTRVVPTRVRIPDISVLRAAAPREQVTLTPLSFASKSSPLRTAFLGSPTAWTIS